MSVTFLVFSHHLRCSRELCLTFEAPSGGPLEEQQSAYLTFMSAPPTPSLSLSLANSQSPGSSRPRCLVLTSCICCCPQLPRELAGLCSLYRLSDKDGKGELTVQPDFQTVKIDSFTADRPGTPLCWAMSHITIALCVLFFWGVFSISHSHL